jgi:membrane protein
VARFRAVFQGYRGVQITVRAAALTYISIFSLIPLAGVALVLLRVFGEEAFEMRVERFMLRLLSPGVAEDTMTMLRGILNQASAKVAGLLGFATLFVSAVPLVQNLDGSLNQVWNVKENRPYPIRVLVWLAAIIAVPLVLGVTLSATSLLHRVLVFIGMPFRGSCSRSWRPSSPVRGAHRRYVVTPQLQGPLALRPRRGDGGRGAVERCPGPLLELRRADLPLRHALRLAGRPAALPPLALVSWLLVLVGARLAHALQTRGRGRSGSRWSADQGRSWPGCAWSAPARCWLDKAHAPSRAMVARRGAP